MPLSPDVLSRYKADVFVETGTYLGEAVEIALALGFPAIHSIEFDEGLAKAAHNKYKDTSGVIIYRGSSGKLLSQVLKDIEGTVTLWLDAHPYLYPLTLNKTPLREELEAIEKAGAHIKVIAVLIDDMRVFSAEDQDWLENRLRSIFPAYTICREDSRCAAADILVAKERQ